MAKRKTRQRPKEQKPSSKESPAQKGWLAPRYAIAGIIVVSLFSAANVAYALYRTQTDLVTTVIVTFLAFVTPGLAAALVYFVRSKLAG